MEAGTIAPEETETERLERLEREQDDLDRDAQTGDVVTPDTEPEPGEAAGDDEPDPYPEADDDEPAEPVATFLRGDGQLGFKVGGKTPTSSSLTLTGGKINVDGQYAKGATVVLRVVARVNDVAFKDKEDPKTGQVIDCTRGHKARILSLSVLDEGAGS
jgi:hypothetical protein